jgi:shikimate kinase
VLVGLPGSGKTTVGRIVADVLRWRHVDTDELVRSATGRTVSDIFVHEGEEAFRDYEHRAIVEALTQSAVVVSAGGGAVTHLPSRALLGEAAPVIWLRADPATLVARLSDQEARSRPLLGADPAAAVRRLARRRAAWYRQVADAVVDVDGLTPSEVAERVLRLVGSAVEAPTGSVVEAPTGSVVEAPTKFATARATVPQDRHDAAMTPASTVMTGAGHSGRAEAPSARRTPTGVPEPRL